MGHQDTPDPPSPIDRGVPQTPSEQITAVILGRIRAGTYPPGSRLPSNGTLAQEFAVAPRTVRKALAPLASQGLIVTRPGWGTFIAGQD